MITEFALYHTDRGHLVEPKSNSKFKALDTDVLDDQQQETPIAKKSSSQAQSKAFFLRKGDGQHGECRQWTLWSDQQGLAGRNCLQVVRPCRRQGAQPSSGITDLHAQCLARLWRTTTQVHALLEVPATAIVIEFFLQLVAAEWILVVFTIIQRKSINEDARKGLRSNGATRCLQIFGENLRHVSCSIWQESSKILSRIYSILLQIDRLLLTAVYCNRRESVKTTPQQTRFRSVNNYKELPRIHIQAKSEYVGTLTTTV